MFARHRLVIIAAVLVAVTGITVALVLWLKPSATPNAVGTVPATVAATLSASSPPPAKCDVLLSRYMPEVVWQQPLNGADRTLPDKVLAAINASLPADTAADVDFYEPTVEGKSDQMLLAIAGDCSLPGARLRAAELDKVLGSVRERTGLVVKNLQLHAGVKEMQLGCADATWGQVRGAFCAWHDGRTLGFAFYRDKKPQDVETNFRAVTRFALG